MMARVNSPDPGKGRVATICYRPLHQSLLHQPHHELIQLLLGLPEPDRMREFHLAPQISGCHETLEYDDIRWIKKGSSDLRNKELDRCRLRLRERCVLVGHVGRLSGPVLARCNSRARPEDIPTILETHLEEQRMSYDSNLSRSSC